MCECIDLFCLYYAKNFSNKGITRHLYNMMFFYHIISLSYHNELNIFAPKYNKLYFNLLLVHTQID